MKFRGLQIPLFEASGLQIRWNGAKKTSNLNNTKP